MRTQTFALLATTALVAAFVGTQARSQPTTGTIEAHMAMAKVAAGEDNQRLYDALCTSPSAGPNTGAPRADPERSTWHVEPVKVFDNLYFVGEKEYSAWAVNTSEGIILVDTIWHYSVQDEVEGGLRKLGLDPARLKYAIVSHAHIDHIGGAKYLQEKFGTRIILSEVDWQFAETSTRLPTKPKRDMIAYDGQKLTLGDTTLTMYLTPGHTLGTISTLIPVRDNGVPHLAAEWGGTGFNFEHSRARFETYAASAQRFGNVVAQSGADVHIANHTNQDGSKVKMAALEKRRPGEPHPYVIGNDPIRRYMKVAEECARVGALREK
jgi:metallo-beta-lactamase class B